MARSDKPLVWSLFAAGGTLAAFLAPVLALLLLLASLGHPPAVFDHDRMLAWSSHWIGRAAWLVVISLFLWHAAHRARITLHDLGLRQDAVVAAVVYLGAALGTLATLLTVLTL
jgi:fumarate reductase subunit D